MRDHVRSSRLSASIAGALAVLAITARPAPIVGELDEASALVVRRVRKLLDS